MQTKHPMGNISRGEVEDKLLLARQLDDARIDAANGRLADVAAALEHTRTNLKRSIDQDFELAVRRDEELAAQTRALHERVFALEATTLAGRLLRARVWFDRIVARIDAAVMTLVLSLDSDGGPGADEATCINCRCPATGPGRAFSDGTICNVPTHAGAVPDAAP